MSSSVEELVCTLTNNAGQAVLNSMRKLKCRECIAHS